jgi:hypothetical protein
LKKLITSIKKSFVCLIGIGAIVLLALAARPANADLCIYNTMPPTFAHWAWGFITSSPGLSFSTGNSAFTLNEVDLQLGEGEQTGSSGPGTPTISLFQDSGQNSPGTNGGPIGSVPSNFNYNDQSDEGAEFKLTGLSIPLLSNTRYWIVLSSTESDAEWADAPYPDNGNYGVGAANEYIANSPWGENESLAAAGDTYEMAIYGTVVPEPATICLLGLGALSLIRSSRRPSRLGLAETERREP